MSFLSNTVIAVGMSADAFAAATCRGVALRQPRLKEAVRIGLVFGGVETLTPLIGWLIGAAAGGMIAAIDHWVAFSLLAAIGGKMIYEGLDDEERLQNQGRGLGALVLTAIGTSIDAMAVGVTLALLKADILEVAMMIGATSALMATVGIMTGHYIGIRAGKVAEICGGLCLMAIGGVILYEHLSAY